MSKNLFRDLASQATNYKFSISDQAIEEAILIRLVEEKFLELFSEGKMNGTVHTCVGQEFSAVAIAGQLQEDDWITSNHRCHGHFISKTKKWEALIDELMGFESGVCKGIGSSQHLYTPGFLSNGPQAALVPVATGIALHKKINKKNGIAVSYIGEGTLGEGVLYEALNLASLFKVPHLIVCENNLYSQSTAQEDGVSGSILRRADAFGIKTFEADTWDLDNLFKIASDAIEYVRAGMPAFFLIKTYRLNPHSKGDDTRDVEEVSFFNEKDSLTKLLKIKKWEIVANKIADKIRLHIEQPGKKTLNYCDYVFDQLPRDSSTAFQPVINSKKRMVQAFNDGYRQTLVEGAFHIGEDISDPYGGAFKVTKGLSTDFPLTVKNTSISESGLIGIAIGMSMMGTKSFAEIMFGDFMTHSFDQLISNASKIHHMYAFQASVPIRVRTPMGGKRGYGPTHSQSLEKHFMGIDNLGVIAFSSLQDPCVLIENTKSVQCPLILIENKTDYGKYLWQDSSYYELQTEVKNFASLKLTHKLSPPSLTIVSYGETARHLADNLEKFFVETDFIPELICVTQLHPLDTKIIESSLKVTRKILVVEDGSINFGFGSELIASLVEKNIPMDWVKRIGAESVPIPSLSSLEMDVLPTIDRIISQINIRKSKI